MWKPEHRIAADRSGLRYPSDLTGAEWAVVEPMVPPAKPGGRKRTIDVREILNGIFYVLWTGCQWQALQKDLPPKSTVWAYFDLWTWDGTLERGRPTTEREPMMTFRMPVTDRRSIVITLLPIA
jgi:transposase